MPWIVRSLLFESSPVNWSENEYQNAWHVKKGIRGLHCPQNRIKPLQKWEKPIFWRHKSLIAWGEVVRTFNVLSDPWAFKTRYITLDWNSFLLRVLANGWNLNCLKTPPIPSLLCFLNQRWHLDWVALHILFFCALGCKPSLPEKQHVHGFGFSNSKTNLILLSKMWELLSLHFLLWTFSVWETEIIRFKISAVF